MISASVFAYFGTIHVTYLMCFYSQPIHVLPFHTSIIFAPCTSVLAPGSANALACMSECQRERWSSIYLSTSITRTQHTCGYVLNTFCSSVALFSVFTLPVLYLLKVPVCTFYISINARCSLQTMLVLLCLKCDDKFLMFYLPWHDSSVSTEVHLSRKADTFSNHISDRLCF